MLSLLSKAQPNYHITGILNKDHSTCWAMHWCHSSFTNAFQMFFFFLIEPKRFLWFWYSFWIKIAIYLCPYVSDKLRKTKSSFSMFHLYWQKKTIFNKKIFIFSLCLKAPGKIQMGIQCSACSPAKGHNLWFSPSLYEWF